jgi:hypothetical protein
MRVSCVAAKAAGKDSRKQNKAITKVFVFIALLIAPFRCE